MRWHRWTRHGSAAVAIVIALVGLPWAWLATYRGSFAPLGRDQGIFQYVAWALLKGQRDYAEIREINGPLIHFIHVLFLKLGGADEHVFRTLDFTWFALVALGVGALLPGLGETRARPRGPVPWWERVAWALASWVVLSAGYLLFDWWNLGQRESFYNTLLIPSLVLQMWSQRPSVAPKVRRWALFAAGALSVATWFGKPTCALYSVGQLAGILFDDELSERKLPNVVAFVLGSTAGGVGMLGLSFATGDPIAGARIIFFEVPRLYRFIWHKSFAECYVAWGNAPKLNYAMATAVLAAVLLLTRRLPRRTLPLVVFLWGGIATFFVQHKGFPYHLHAVIAGVHLTWLVAAAVWSERIAATGDAGDEPPAASNRGWRRVTQGPWRWALVAAGALLLAYQCMTELRLSPSMQNDWYAVRASEGAESRRFLGYFQAGDFFALDLRDAAAFLRDVTRPDERVQTYGMDPYLLFLAQRLSATPYIYGFELNVEAALQAGAAGADGEWLRATAQRHERELLAGLERQPPAAFALIDRQPFTLPEDADADFAAHCPNAASWLHARYRPAARFGVVRVWLREDVYERNLPRLPKAAEGT